MSGSSYRRGGFRNPIDLYVDEVFVTNTVTNATASLASASYVDASVSSLQSSIDAKANSADLSSLQSTVSAKADSSYVDSSVSSLQNSINLKADASDLSIVSSDLATLSGSFVACNDKVSALDQAMMVLVGSEGALAVDTYIGSGVEFIYNGQMQDINAPDPVPDWASGVEYDLNDQVNHNGVKYTCVSLHTSDNTTEPGVGSSWETYWYIE